MSFFLFVDESGQDHNQSPYEVLAGVCIEDKDLWNIVRLVNDISFECFDCKYNSPENREAKAKKFLNKKTFRLAAQMPPIQEEERMVLAKEALMHGDKATRLQLTALAQAKLDYSYRILKLCHAFGCKAFASIVVNPSSITKLPDMLRKDYVFLFERFYYFLESKRDDSNGIIVCDEIEKTSSHLLIRQMDKYFQRTGMGNVRSNLIIPEPFFVHSELSTGIQIADFIAYLISWNFRANPALLKPKRTELNQYMNVVDNMQFAIMRNFSDTIRPIYGFKVV
jgi:Protein of unknown function (DUF3800)